MTSPYVMNSHDVNSAAASPPVTTPEAASPGAASCDVELSYRRGVSSVGDRIEQILKAKDISARELARRSGLGETQVSVLVARFRKNPHTHVTVETLRAIAQGAGVSLAWLTSGDGSPETREDPPPPTELRMVPDGDARPSIGAQPDARALADEIALENPPLAPYLDIVLDSGSMRSLNIPLTRAALETLARVVQSHGQRRGR